MTSLVHGKAAPNEGGAGEDSIDLRNHKAQHTIRLHGQTETSRDKIFDFLKVS